MSPNRGYKLPRRGGSVYPTERAVGGEGSGVFTVTFTSVVQSMGRM